MYKKIFYALGLALLMTGYTFAQNATLKGKVTDQNGKPVEFANVRLMQEDDMILGTTTDEHGNYTLKPVPSGKLDLIVTYSGCAKYKREGIAFSGSTVKFQDVQINCGKNLKEIVVTDTKPIFEKDQVVAQQTMTAEDMETMSGKSVSSALNTMSGLTTTSGGGTSIRGNRTGQLVYMVDGVRSGNDVAFAGVASTTMISGGIPAKYGDGAGFVEIETKGASRSFKGSVDMYDVINGYYTGGMQFSLTGPILKKLQKRTDSLMSIHERKTKLNSAGFFLSGSLSYNPGSTSAKGGYYEAPQSLIDELKANPLRIEDDGVNYNNTLYITKDQWGKSKKRLSNATSYGGSLFGKLDIRTSYIDVIATGKLSYSEGQSYSFSNSLYNTENNGFSKSWTGAAMLRLTQRFRPDTSSIFQNAFYRIQFSYERGSGMSYSKKHKENIFDYGYIGEIRHKVTPYYELGSDSLYGRKLDNVYRLTSFAYLIDTFIPGDKNPDLARYTENVFGTFGSNILYDNHIQSLGGLLNGEAPSGAAYGLFSAPGVAYNGIGRSLSDVLDFSASLSFDIKDHGIEMGFQYYQSISHSHSVSPRGLWTLMRTLANDHIRELDENSAYGTYDETGTVFTDTVNYKRLVNKESQKVFDRNLREKLGAAEDEWIDIDRYDPETYSLDMFSAEELLNNGNAYISYYGYDYTGKHVNNKAITMDDMQKWFNGEDGKRDFTSIGAYKPIYMAGYIQDHFAIKNLFFNVGVRLDVNDANQPVVKDMYLYREAYTAKEVSQMNVKFTDKDYRIPASIGDDYTVYVQDPTAAEMEVTAYRSGTTWYDPQGNEVTDPADLAQAASSANLTPYLKEMPGASDQTKVSYKAFQDYTPTLENGGISIAPRLSFSFAVSDESVFYAHYNVMSKRQNSRISPVYYLFIEDYAKGGSQCSNTGLKPEKSIDYEVGFRQKLSENMALNMSAYYSEKRDQVQVYRYTEAYPATYYSYTNIDFGTTQGFTIGLEMRKTKHVSFTTNYTLQFAKGTGSSSTSAANMIAMGQPNLRTLTTLAFDQRHVLNANINLSNGRSEGVKLPLKKKEVFPLENAGMSITAKAGSGLPYTRSSTIVSLTGQGASQLVGSIYGSRMPWQYSCNMKFYKYWFFKMKKTEDKREQKIASLQAYLDISNIFNFSNITSVYRYTGNASDDGFLTAEEFQSYISQQTCPESYIDYYTYAMTAGRLGSARVITLGAMFNF
ncbi:MAG: carboxypeptidase regulatory-like domain-containing protein [Bacteroidales bacterium]|nr:carboxypeptidase regulatory-like domain-containing protein [Bacteroidales bacterium]